MQKSEAIAWFGSQSKLAEFLGVAQSNVCSWKRIPLHHQPRIEEHTQGELTSDPLPSKKVGYRVVIEKRYLDIIKSEAEKTGLPCIEVLRRAITLYQKRNSKC